MGPLKRPQASQGLGWYCPCSDAHIALGSPLISALQIWSWGNFAQCCLLPLTPGLTPCRAR